MSKSKRRPLHVILAAVLGLALLAAYANSFRVPFIFDDQLSITENTSLRSWKTAFLPPGNSGATVSGRPLLNATFALNWALGGSNVIGYHLTNLLIHFLAALTLFGLARRTFLLPSLREKFGVHASQLAFAVSAIWALHPLQTESVTYIVQRAESLAGLFYLLTLYSFVRSTDTPAHARRWQIAALLACLAGMGSKEVMVSAPLIVFLFDRTFVAGSFATAWRARKKLHLGFAATWILLALCITSTGNRGGTVGVGGDLSIWKYLLTQCEAIPLYLRLVVWPHPLVHDYGTPVVHRLGDVICGSLFVTSLLVATAILLVRAPRCAVLALLFFAVLAPTSSFVPINTQTIAEHRMYLAVAPLVALLVIGLYRISGPRLSLALCTLAATASGVVTHSRNHDYRSTDAIWRDASVKRPDNFRPWSALASHYTSLGLHKEAEDASRAALERNPGNLPLTIKFAHALRQNGKTAQALEIFSIAMDALPPGGPPDPYETTLDYAAMLLTATRIDDAIAQFHVALRLRQDGHAAHLGLADALDISGRPAESIAHYETALRTEPGSANTYNNYGNVLLKLGRLDDGLRVLEKGLALDPASEELRINRSLALARKGRSSEARAALEQLLADNPLLASAHSQLAGLLATGGDTLRAIHHYRRAIGNGQDDASTHASLATLLLQHAEPAEAAEAFESACQRAPNDADLLYRLANARLQSGALAQAATAYERVLTLAPSSIEARNELGITYAQLGRMDDARVQFEAALKIDPRHARARENLARVLAE
jgi:tetratricopeptide (TPR) repeat protein